MSNKETRTNEPVTNRQKSCCRLFVSLDNTLLDLYLLVCNKFSLSITPQLSSYILFLCSAKASQRSHTPSHLFFLSQICVLCFLSFCVLIFSTSLFIFLCTAISHCLSVFLFFLSRCFCTLLSSLQSKVSLCHCIHTHSHKKTHTKNHTKNIHNVCVCVCICMQYVYVCVCVCMYVCS